MEREARMHQLRLFLVLGSVTAVGPIAVDAYLPAFPTLSRDFNADASSVQLTLTGLFAGLALGQVVAGPLSDALGRRRPLVFGLVAYVVASVACALAPSVGVLIVFRLLQGLGAATGVVIARAIVRDLFTGNDAARFFSLLVVVTAVSPIFAPLAGSLVLRLTSWRGIFAILAVVSAILVAAVLAWLHETLPPERRRPGGLPDALRSYRRLLSDRVFLGYALTFGVPFIGIFGYISGSSFVLQNLYGLSPQTYGLLFGMNGLGLVAASQVNRYLVGRVRPTRLLGAGLVGFSAGTVVLIGGLMIGGLGVLAVVVPLAVLVASVGFVAPNATALALSGHPEMAGTGSAILGIMQFGLGAVAAPLIGLAGTRTAMPMAIGFGFAAAGAVAAFALIARAAPAAGPLVLGEEIQTEF
ncbi:MAG: transporter, family, multidrug resistance protein [Chloroflexota bacterium]|jgi:DHA1 family bicyclomycin/chloramphenicol resistance-like MFS transporter|nr:transporter, family, multidrug resistance protein [Chloroflexota bacterium]